ncbi:MAG: galactosyltransferase-related protein [Rhodococcus sp. (in: high G+C Gram-positive bacteria)]
MRIAVVTVVSGRHRHLVGQLRGLDASSVQPSEHIVISMGDPQIATVVHGAPHAAVSLLLVESPGPGLPLARARNLGAQTAIESGAELVVFLDVDCIPGVDMLARYVAASEGTDAGDALLCGPVTYLPPNPTGWSTRELIEATAPHPARPNPPANTVIAGTDYDLFWSLSFAVTPQTWKRVGGFFEGYSGYGGEDTDFAASARAAGVGLRWVGGAHAYHQHHPVSSPPVEHVDDIVRNAAVFRRRWNRWPMEGWLREFEARGLIERDDTGTIRRTARG